MATEHEAETGTGQNGHEEEVARYEQELADYLQERIKPGRNSGAIPLLARSIAKEIAHREHPCAASEDAEAEDGRSAEARRRPTSRPTCTSSSRSSAKTGSCASPSRATTVG